MRSRSRKKRSTRRRPKRNSERKCLIYVKPGCSACENAKKLFKTKKIRYRSVNGIENQIEVDRMMERIGRSDFKTWPKIFDIQGKFVGGFSDLQKILLG